MEDIRKINTIAVRAKRTGMIILGGGIVKHHIANANLMRNGAESAVYINTGQEFDGSDAGARPDEAVSWGKIKADAASVKVRWDKKSISLPLVRVTNVSARSTPKPLLHSHSSWPPPSPKWTRRLRRPLDNRPDGLGSGRVIAMT